MDADGRAKSGRHEIAAVRMGKRRVRIRRSVLEDLIAAGEMPAVAPDDRQTPQPAAVDEGSATAWATFGAALAEATEALHQTDRRELLAVLERLVEATQALADSLTAPR
jgi:hypothetical protein